MPKTKKDDQLEVRDPTSADNDAAAWRTGPNVDIGIEPGAVTVDPETAHGQAARATREANGASTSVTDDGVEVVDQPDAPYGPKVMSPADARAVLEYEENIKAKQELQQQQ